MFVPSPACVYRVIPLVPVRNVPSVGELAVPTVTAPAGPGIDVPGAALVVDDAPLAEQAATIRPEARTSAAIWRTAGTWVSEGGAGTTSVLTTSGTLAHRARFRGLRGSACRPQPPRHLAPDNCGELRMPTMQGHDQGVPSVVFPQTGIPDRECQSGRNGPSLSLIHISEPTRLGMNSYAVFCLK